MEAISLVLAVCLEEVQNVVQSELLIFVAAIFIYAAGSQSFARGSRGKPKGKPSVSKESVKRGTQSTPARPKVSSSEPERKSNNDVQRAAAKIKTCARAGDLQGAEAAFTASLSCCSSSHQVLYNHFLDACVQCGDMKRATSLLNDMKSQKMVDVVSYNTLVKGHLAAENIENARALLADMGSQGIQANRVTYNELLHSMIMTKKRSEMWNVIKEMRQADISADSVTCSILLKSLTVQSPPWDVKRVLGLIDELEQPADEILYSSIIDTCIRLQQVELLSDFVKQHRQKLDKVKLSTPSYGSMIKAFGQAGKIDNVWQVWNDMEGRDVNLSSVTLGCMVEALVTNQQSAKAWDLVMQQLGRSDRCECVNTVIYTTVLKGFANMQDIERVFMVYEKMRATGVTCNTITLNTLLEACAKCRSMDKVSSVLSDMKNDGIELDIISYSTILKGFCCVGDLDRAFGVLDDMKRTSDIVPDEIMYNSILDGCAKQSRVKEALRILDEMKAAQVPPSNYTVSILVKLLGHERRLDKAFKMMEDLSSQNGFKPNVQVYTCLIQACIRSRRLDRALAVHDRVAADPSCRVDEKFYATLLRGCLTLREPLKAADLIRTAYQLPGSTSLASQRFGARPIGVDGTTLEEVVSRLRAGNQTERDALTNLTKDLQQHRNLHLNDLLHNVDSSRAPARFPQSANKRRTATA